ncbi:MAG: hypothetical protein EOP84_11050 [Verrucomicrobiaceae bacterium]|nr:MAG: hypothetical protein EOP84_11050 [Verrucomicrobiaceae bacterium]
MAYKLDMFAEVLPAIDQHDYEFLERQSEDARKGFAPPVVLRFAATVRQGVYTDLMLLQVNGRANLDFYDLTAHPELQWRLLASCGLGVGTRHEWIALPATRTKSSIHGFLWQYWPDASEAEITLLLNQFTRETFIDFTRECGLSPADEKAALDAYDKYTGHAPKKKASKPKKR